jgi:molecular chaperone HscB
LQRCEQLLDREANAEQAAQQVRALMFIERFAADVDARFERMEALSRGQ